MLYLFCIKTYKMCLDNVYYFCELALSLGKGGPDEEMLFVAALRSLPCLSLQKPGCGIALIVEITANCFEKAGVPLTIPENNIMNLEPSTSETLQSCNIMSERTQVTWDFNEYVAVCHIYCLTRKSATL